MPQHVTDERRPLLENGHSSPDYQDGKQKVDFDEDDAEDPKNWSLRWKYIQTLQIFLIAFVCPMASSILAPANDDIATEFHTSKKAVLGAQTVFVCMLGIGPLIHAPLSETFGRRIVFLTNLSIFVLLQIPTALANDVVSFIILRCLGGFFGSVGVANGGGSISDMFETHERAPVLGVYLIAPLLGPTIGPLIGGVVVGNLDWRWIFWIVCIMSGCVVMVAFLFLHETRAVTILQSRKAKLENQNPDKEYVVEGVDDSSFIAKVAQNSTRAVRMLATQPIVMTMSLYQALVFSSMYSLYAQWTSIWTQSAYDFNITQIGLLYLGPAIGFILTSVVMVALIDKVYNFLCKRYDSEGAPEFRLPLTIIGVLFLPVSLFWFGWSAEYQLHWPILFVATMLFGASQVSIFNAVQTYYIDAFESNAASALAAGAFLRSLVGGIVPLFVAGLFDSLGYGWGMSVFGILSVILMPAPLLFYYYGRTLRDKFPFKG